MTYEELLTRNSQLMEIGKLTLPRKVSYAIARNLVSMEAEVKIYLNQIRDIAERYVVKNENGEFKLDDSGKYVFASDEDKQNYEQELKELGETSVDFKLFSFDVKELDKCETSDRFDILTPIQEGWLYWMTSESTHENQNGK